ncbi:MAG: aldolase [Hyphomicrobiaceae bacterium]|nr:aldolase [Hyphomicrobiaceae bacterium]
MGNPARERLQNGELAIGIGLRQARTVDIASAMKTCGFDWLFIDLEHGAIGLDTAVQISVAALGVGISPIVRVPKARYDLATRALDGGAFGIVMPHVDTAAEAREIVDRLKLPPAGHRSITGAMPQLGFAAAPLAEAAATLNANMLVVVMLETPEAIANAEAIAAVPGIDALLIGTNDLTCEMGIPGELMHERVAHAYEVMVAACRKHGKWAGMGGVYSDEGLRRYIGLGVRLILGGSDLSFLMAAGQARTKSLRAIG